MKTATKTANIFNGILVVFLNKIDQAVERGAVSKKAVQESLVAALEESRVYHPVTYGLGIIGKGKGIPLNNPANRVRPE